MLNPSLLPTRWHTQDSRSVFPSDIGRCPNYQREAVSQPLQELSYGCLVELEVIHKSEPHSFGLRSPLLKSRLTNSNTVACTIDVDCSGHNGVSVKLNHPWRGGQPLPIRACIC